MLSKPLFYSCACLIIPSTIPDCDNDDVRCIDSGPELFFKIYLNIVCVSAKWNRIPKIETCMH